MVKILYTQMVVSSSEAEVSLSTDGFSLLPFVKRSPPLLGRANWRRVGFGFAFGFVPSRVIGL